MPLQKYQRFMDAELQQRAIEYSALAKKTDMKESVLGLM